MLISASTHLWVAQKMRHKKWSPGEQDSIFDLGKLPIGSAAV